MLEVVILVRASHHVSPLRYPGGKAKLTPYIKSILRANRLLDCTYIEPFAGGAGVGLSLLVHGYVKRVVINDLSLPIFSFWKAALQSADAFCDRIERVDLTVEEWRRQRETFQNQEAADPFELGFATFYLNRTNHSGVLNGGMIGGLGQKSAYGLDARFNRQELVARIRRLEKQKEKITLEMLDAQKLLIEVGRQKDFSTFIYADPPYFVKGRDLYYDFYKSNDHELLRDEIERLPEGMRWVVSYDNVKEITELYKRYRSVEYDLSYSVKNGSNGKEIMFFSDSLSVPTPN